MMNNPLQAQLAALSRLVRELGDAPPGLLKARGWPGIYQNAYRARLIAALRDNYTVLQRALGDEAFDALALGYIDAHPSQQASIRWFGDKLAGFMAEREDLVPHPALIDFARMDWALRGAFDAPDAPALSLADLTRTPPEAWGGLRFALHPSVQTVALAWAIEPIWHVLRDHLPESGNEEAPEMAEPEALPHRLLVWRQGLETRWRSLEAREALLLQAVAEGRNFGELCAALADELGNDEAAATQAVVTLMAQWLNDGLLRAPMD